MPAMTGLRVAWQFAKKYAWILFAVLAAALALVLWGTVPSLSDRLESINKRHEEELARIREADALRIREREESQKRFDDAMRTLDDRYKQALANLDAGKQAEVDRILTQHGDDPEALAAELAAALGLQVQPPNG